MPTLFTRIIDGEIPGRFVWEDDQCVAFLTIAPLSPGHTLVVPRAEIDHWHEADTALLTHCVLVAQTIGSAISVAFAPRRVAQIIAGFEVPHMHIHVFGAASESDLDFTKADSNVPAEDLDRHAEKLRTVLTELGRD